LSSWREPRPVLPELLESVLSWLEDPDEDPGVEPLVRAEPEPPERVPVPESPVEVEPDVEEPVRDDEEEGEVGEVGDVDMKCSWCVPVAGEAGAGRYMSG
jgi:hypothetical protein